jgi:hypothetical protein
MTIVFQTEHYFKANGFDPDNLDRWTDEVLDILIDSGEAVDADVTATLTTGRVIFVFSIEGVDHDEALQRSVALMSKCVEAAVTIDTRWRLADIVTESATAKLLQAV